MGHGNAPLAESDCDLPNRAVSVAQFSRQGADHLYLPRAVSSSAYGRVVGSQGIDLRAGPHLRFRERVSTAPRAVQAPGS